LRFDFGRFIVVRMARTPLARAVQDAAAAADADSRRTTRRTFVREASVAAFGLTALGRFAASARASGGPRIVVVGAGLAGLTCAYRLRQAGYNVDLHEASGRAGGRCWTIRGAFAEGQIAEHGGEFIDTGHDAMRGLVRELGFRLDDLPRAEQSGTEVLGFFDGHPYTYAAMAADFKVAWPTLKRDVADADYPTTYYQSTPRGRELDAMSIIDYLDEAIPGGSSSKLGQLLDVAYTIEYGADSARQSSLNLLYLLGYSGPKLRIFGESDERFHVAGGNDQVPAALASVLGNDIAYESELVSVTKRSGGDFSLGFREDGRTRTVTADKVVLALPFAIIRRSVDISRAGFSNRKRTAIAEQGMGTNSKLHLQFGHGLPEHLGGDARAAGHGRHPRRLHRRHDRCELRHRDAVVTRQAVPRTDRARPPRHHKTVERTRDDRLLARLRMDERLVRVLEGRAIHPLRRRRERAAGELPLRRRAHLTRLPGVPERGGRVGRARRRRDPRRPRLVLLV
jgi:monoamine oxidase